MRFKLKEPQDYSHDEQRTIKKFLFLPKRIDYEVRWLELTSYTQIYNKYYNEWQDHRWVG